jgi:hypothetical protein
MKTQKGVALLVALSVTLILGIFLANNFERNRTNLKLLSNTESKFFLNTINFSVLKAITLAIKRNGANYVYDFVSILGSIPDFPISITTNPNINIYNPQIWSMQHYYYLNRKNFDANEQQLFNGILNLNLQNSGALASDEDGIALKENSITNELKQWYSNTANSGFVAGFPVYRRNGYFDLHSEFHFFLRHAMKKKGKILEEGFEDALNFRIYSTKGKNEIDIKKDDSLAKDRCGISPLNINMIPKNSKTDAEKIITDYFKWFDFHSAQKCKDIKKNGEKNVLSAIESQFYGEEDGLLLITEIGNNHFGERLNGMDNKVKNHFTYRSNLVGVRYELEHNENRIKIELHLYLEYKSDNRSVEPDAIHILYYNVS